MNLKGHKYSVNRNEVLDTSFISILFSSSDRSLLLQDSGKSTISRIRQTRKRRRRWRRGKEKMRNRTKEEITERKEGRKKGMEGR